MTVTTKAFLAGVATAGFFTLAFYGLTRELGPSPMVVGAFMIVSFPGMIVAYPFGPLMKYVDWLPMAIAAVVNGYLYALIWKRILPARV